MNEQHHELLLTEQNGLVWTLVLNRPDKRNALNPELLTRLDRTLEELAERSDVRVLVIRGSGDKAFCAGFDINKLPTRKDTGEQTSFKRINPFEQAMERIFHFPYPVIAMLNGQAFGGGCDLAVSCDVRIAADGIRMGMVPAKMGVVYSPEGLRRFIRTIGVSSTKEMFFSGRVYKAQRLKELGLIDYLVPRADLEAFTYELAEDIAGNAPLSLKGTKRVLNLILQTGELSPEALQEADQIIENAYRSEDLKEGQKAFFERRKPKFEGR